MIFSQSINEVWTICNSNGQNRHCVQCAYIQFNRDSIVVVVVEWISRLTICVLWTLFATICREYVAWKVEDEMAGQRTVRSLHSQHFVAGGDLRTMIECECLSRSIDTLNLMLLATIMPIEYHHCVSLSTVLSTSSPPLSHIYSFDYDWIAWK